MHSADKLARVACRHPNKKGKSPKYGDINAGELAARQRLAMQAADAARRDGHWLWAPLTISKALRHTYTLMAGASGLWETVLVCFAEHISATNGKVWLPWCCCCFLRAAGLNPSAVPWLD
jgi:hypothetical protein